MATAELNNKSASDSMDPKLFDAAACYHTFLEDQELSTPVATFKVFTEFIKCSQAPTVTEFLQTLTQVGDTIQAASMYDAKEWKLPTSTRKRNPHKATIATLAGIHLFNQFVRRNTGDFTELEELKANLLARSTLILQKATSARDRIAVTGSQFVHDNAVILVHSYSRTVMSVLQYAANVENKRFKVYVTEGRPTSDGLTAVSELQASGIPCAAVLDSAVGFILDKVDMVFVGAEGVVENGGIINQIGTYQIALVAKALGKPIYAIAESYKFVRLYPLNQYDLPSITPDIVTFSNRRKSSSNALEQADESQSNDLALSNPSVDYTPPQYLTLLLTDLGVLTPSGVSDELIKLYL
ncbi:hypothetical protein INT43_005716 [Umbelopsis isabellina]|uniref:Translation initiation factor eIF2B subunit alpha n=1 Tax=Mortierella isabellina TaxID=91625 RepID=A0A8H7PNP1_MORIS|nr:hypothetical protein INT43_005716 [Umbelopsis isabellina]